MNYIYCDESCHLPKDRWDLMVLGAITCHGETKDIVIENIKKLKIKHGLSPYFEIKWTKVSQGKIEFYKELINLFFEMDLNFRYLIAKGKKSLDNEKYNNGSFDEWYYKMYYLLLNKVGESNQEYRIFIDVKDTRGGSRIKKLHEILCNSQNSYNIKKIEQIHSHESEILQLADILIGAIAYNSRNLKDSNSKLEVVNILKEKSGSNLETITFLKNKKFNCMIWEPRI